MKSNRNPRIVLLALLGLAATQVHAVANQQWISTTSGCMVSASEAMPKDVKASWSGSCSDGYADGKGILTWSNGNRYEGELYVGTISGKGVFYWANGDWYEGNFKDGRREGIGIQHFGCLGQYHGEFHNGVMDGLGVLDMADGNHYEGGFRKGLMDGLGKHSFTDGSKYEGQFKNNQQEGIGSLVLANHSHLEGEFQNNRPEGPALVTYPNGDFFEGRYVDGRANGRGILTKPNGERDVGNFQETKGVLNLISNIGPSLYEPCSTHCTSSIAFCSNTISGMNPEDPNYQFKLIDAQVSCAREMQQCTSMCARQNPTVVELKGIVEIGEVDGSTTALGSTGNRETRSPGTKAAVSFVDEQMATTSDLRARLAQQRQQLDALQQRIASLPKTPVSASGPSTNCRAPARRKS